MELKEYFDSVKGFGVLSTSDNSGKVNSAVYARPHVMEDGSLAFIMRDRLTFKNIQANAHASYLFKEDSAGYKGKRLFLTRIRIEEDRAVIDSLSRRDYDAKKGSSGPKFLVFFKLEGERPLVGSGQ